MVSTESIAQESEKQVQLRKMRRNAMNLAAKGFEVFPLHRIASYSPLVCGCGDKECTNAGKHPAVDKWILAKTSEEKAVRRLWFDIPYCGIAIATGKGSNVWVLDVDVKAAGFVTLAALEETHGKLPHTATAITGSGGKHFYFKYPGPEYRNTAGRLGPGLDTRGDGGLVVAPPSPHKSGNEYTWENSPEDTELAEVPAWLLELLKSEAPVELPKSSSSSSDFPAPTHEEAMNQLETLLKHPLVVWASENPDSVNQGLWWSLCRSFSTLANDCPELLEDAADAFQDLSEGHHTYSRSNTSKMFARCLKEHGPIAFNTMVQNGAPAHLIGETDGRDLVSYARRNAPIPVPVARAPSKKPEDDAPAPKPSAPKPSAPKTTSASLAAAPAPAGPPSLPPGRPKLPLKMGTWDDKAEERFYYDVARRVYRYIKSPLDPDDPGGLSEGFSKQGICQVITSDYGMPFKAAQAIVDSLRKMGEPVVDPAKPYGVIQRGDQFSFNRFIGGKIIPVKGAWPTIDALMLNLTGGVQADKEYALDWLAVPLQALYNLRKLCKLRTAIVFHGPEGAGKNTLVRLMSIFYGEKNVATINQNTISGRFQGIMEYKLFISANEVRPRDDGSDDRLKELITDSRLMMERKGVEAYETDNLANFIFSSNRDRPVHAGDVDRRYSIFHTGPQAAKLGALIHQDIETTQTETAAFLYHLLNRTITHDVNKPFDNHARIAVQTQNLSPAQTFVNEVREFGFASIGQGWLKMRSDDPSRSLRLSEDTNDVEYNTLFEVYSYWLRSNRYRNGGGSNKYVLTQFRKAGLIGEPKRRVVGGNRYTYYDTIPFEPEGEAGLPVSERTVDVKVSTTKNEDDEDRPFGDA